MYSLALIIFVVSEKAFEHFPIGSNVNLQSLCFLCRSEIQDGCHHSRKSKMAATTGHSINTGPYGENTEICSFFPIGSNVKLSPAVATILNFISEQKTYSL
jgi:hypothetical protein